MDGLTTPYQYSQSAAPGQSSQQSESPDSAAQADPTSSNATCPDCQTSAVNDGQELICPHCGLIIKTSDQSTSRHPNVDSPHSDAYSRTGPSAWSHTSNLSTEIGYPGSRFSDYTASESNERQLKRLKRRHYRATHSQNTATIRDGRTAVNRIATAVGLPSSASDRSFHLFKSMRSDGYPQSRSVEATAAVAVYIASRETEHSRPLKRLAHVSATTLNRIRKLYNALNKETPLNLPPQHPREYIPRLIDALEVDIPAYLQTQAADIADFAHDTCFTTRGVSPQSVAAAAVYIATQNTPHSCTQRELAEASTVSIKPISTRINTLSEALPLDRTELLTSTPSSLGKSDSPVSPSA